MKNASHKDIRKWSIAWICSVINFMYLGVPRLSGMLYLAAITRYNVNRNQASLPFVLCYTVRNISGPFIGYLSRKVEIQTLIVSGCLISSLGVGACFFAESIITVSILWGGVFGLGFGLSTILIPCVLNQHFDKYLSNANGIALGGECIAGFVLPPLLEFCLSTYGTSGSFLILSGLILHGVPAALFLNPLHSSVAVKGETSSDSRNYPSTSTERITSEIDTAKEICNVQYDSDSYSGTDDLIFKEEKNLNTKLNETDKQACKKFSQSIDQENRDHRNLANSGVVSHNIDSDITLNPTTVYDENSSQTTISRASFNSTLSSEQYHNLHQTRKADELCDQTTKTQNSNEYSVRSSEPFLKPTEQNSVKNMFRVFLDPTFVLILFTQSSIIFIATTFTTIIVDFSTDVGVAEGQTVYVLMCFSIADMLGRFCLGWVTDGGYLSNVAFSSLCYSILGIILVALVSLRGFPFVLVAVFIYGLFLGGLIVIGPGITSDHIEADKINIALASRFALFTPMSLTQSSMIGYFRDTLGSYNGIFYLLGSHSLVCTVFTILIPFSARCRDRRKLERLNSGITSAVEEK